MHHMHSIRGQRGITTLGWLALMVPVAIVAYVGVRAVPAYLNYGKVGSILDGLAQQAAGQPTLSAADLRLRLTQQLRIDAIEFPTAREFSFIRDGDRWVARVSYEEEIALAGNASLLFRFDKEVVLK
ncbi:MAG: hypothetical protein RL026_285 [Pseudomonadota bacterium]|jgi:hypothetical protein